MARFALILLVLSLATGSDAGASSGPAAVSRPAVSGALQSGQRLTASPGTWTGAGAITYGYQWYRCDPNGAHCLSIHGATRATYVQVARDVGRTLALTVSATDSTGTTAGYAPLAGLVAARAAPAAKAQPTLTGDAIVGRTLQVGAV